MCGIAGFLGAEAQRGKHLVFSMLRELERRGPDDGGIAVWENAVIGSRRLAIFDRSRAGRQPILSPDGTIGVVFNGEIYNFRELKKELILSGFRFSTGTDTEVLVHGYA